MILKEAGWALGTCFAGSGSVKFSLVTVGWEKSTREKREGEEERKIDALISRTRKKEREKNMFVPCSTFDRSL